VDYNTCTMCVTGIASTLIKEIFHFVEEASLRLGGGWLKIRGTVEASEGVFFFAREVAGNPYIELNEEISTAVTVDFWKSFAFEA